jgi:hypothetical protein
MEKQNQPSKASRHALARIGVEAAAIRLSISLKYNPRWYQQPRVPRGNPDGGQWTLGGGLRSATSLILPALKRGAMRVLKLATPHVKRYLKRRPYYWKKGGDLPAEHEYDQETRRIGPFTSRRPQHEIYRFKNWREFRDWLGPADPGWEWHHIVEQRLERNGRFAPERIHNTDNIVMLPLEVHRCVSDTMSSKIDALSPVMRFVVEQRPFWVQYNKGLNLIEKCLEDNGYDLDTFRW